MGARIFVELTDEQMQQASRIAHARNDPKVSAGVQSKKVSSQSDLKVHVMGVEAEMAVASLLGCEIDRAARLGGDKGKPDLVWNGKRIEVKARPKRDYDFPTFLKSPEQFGADYGVLVWATNRKGTYEIIGVISRRDFISDCVVEDYSHGKRYVVKNDRMRGVVDFLSGKY